MPSKDRMNILLLLGILVAAVFLSLQQRFNRTFDVTRWESVQLSASGAKIAEVMATLNHPLVVTGFFKDPGVENTFRQTLALFEQHGAKFTTEYLDPDVHVIRAKSEKLRSGNGVIFRSGNRRAVVYGFSEEKLIGAFLTLLRQQDAKLCFTAGHGESSGNDQSALGLSAFVEQLHERSFATQEGIDNAPESCRVVIIAGPKYELDPDTKQQLEHYLAGGGKVLVLTDAMAPTRVLNEILGVYGLRFNPDFIVLPPDDIRIRTLGQNTALIDDFAPTNPATLNLHRNVMIRSTDTRSIAAIPSTNTAKSFVVASTSPDMAKVPNVVVVEDLRHAERNTLEHGSFPFAGFAFLRGEGDLETRIFAVGSSQLITNQNSDLGANFELVHNMITYLGNDTALVAVKPREHTEGKLDLTSSMSLQLLYFLCFGYPFMFLGTGLALAFRRRYL